MKSEEFKARQLWLDFCDGIGTALEVISDRMFEFGLWFKKFCKKPVKKSVNRSKWLWIELISIQQYLEVE